jgi:hypothetical protein
MRLNAVGLEKLVQLCEFLIVKQTIYHHLKSNPSIASKLDGEVKSLKRIYRIKLKSLESIKSLCRSLKFNPGLMGLAGIIRPANGQHAFEPGKAFRNKVPRELCNFSK